MPNEFGSHVKGWDALAPKYDRLITPLEKWILGPSRPWVFERASGRILEIGVGTGINFTHLPADAHYTGTDVSPAMITLAQERADKLNLDLDLRVADASSLPFEDGSFDTVVSTYVFCCVPDEKLALTEALRVLKPGGSLLLASHVGSHHAPINWGQQLLDKVTVPRMGEHFSRRPLNVLRDLDAEIVTVETSLLGVIERLHARPGPEHSAASEPAPD